MFESSSQQVTLDFIRENATFKTPESTLVCQTFEMTLTGDPSLRMKFMKMMSNYWTVFGVVSALVVCLVLELSIVSVSGFSNPHNSATDIQIFSVLCVLSIVSQLIILNFVYTRNVPFEKSILRIM